MENDKLKPETVDSIYKEWKKRTDEEKEKIKERKNEKIFGVKYDNDKLRWDLLPFREVEEVVKVLTKGAKKYSVDNWKNIDDPQNRYFAAAMRHLVAWRMDEKLDIETGINHLAHAVCCLLFLMWFDNENSKKQHQ